MGRRLAQARAVLGLTQAGLAEGGGVSVRAIENYEQGLREMSAIALARLCRAHRIDPYWLLTGETPDAAGWAAPPPA